MCEQNNKPYLSEVIDYDRDILPYQFIKIYAGVGSGKNVFVDHLIKGDLFKHADGSLVTPKTVLLITSRRAKVDEQLEDENTVYDPVITKNIFDAAKLERCGEKYEEYFESNTLVIPDLDGWGSTTVYKRSCVFTNAKIEAYLRDGYVQRESASHPWELFDMIIVDEAHSLIADASYQSAPYYVRRLIEETLAHPNGSKVILMTGTPEILGSLPLYSDAHTIDMMGTCRTVVPKQVVFITAEEANEKKEALLAANEKIFAFMNHVNPIRELAERFPDTAVMSFSKEKALDELKKTNEKVYKRMMDVGKHIAKYQMLPDDVVAFLSTSKNKEGINIKNKDIPTMFVEAHSHVDVVQMAGRIREGAETLYITLDSTGFHDTDDHYEAPFSEAEETLVAVNTFYMNLCKEIGYDPQERISDPKAKDERDNFIDFIHQKFPYIRFDYFTNNFVFYPERRLSKLYYATQTQKYDDAKQTAVGLIKLANEWFPDAICSVSKRVKPQQDRQAAVTKYLVDNHWLNEKRVIKKTERDTILTELNQITGEGAKQLAPILQRYGYSLQKTNRSKNKNAPYKIISLNNPA